MPNRIIKESICTSEGIEALSPMAEVLFYRLMVKADDFGLYHGNPKIIIGACFPLKAVGEEEVDRWVSELISAGLVGRYFAEGKAYLAILSWEKHQQRRASKSKFPLPKEGDYLCKPSMANVPVNENENVNEKGIENVIGNGNGKKDVITNHDKNDCKNKEETKPEEGKPKSRIASPEKIRFAPYTTMTGEEYQKLVSYYGKEDTKRLIEILDNYKGSTGKDYKDDYRAILSWVVSRLSDEKKREGKSANTKAQAKGSGRFDFGHCEERALLALSKMSGKREGKNGTKAKKKRIALSSGVGD